MIGGLILAYILQDARFARTRDSYPTDAATPISTSTMSPTDTTIPPTNTVIPPTATNVPPTNTSVDPTNTAAPTDTPHPVATPTPLPPTPTMTPMVIEKPDLEWVSIPAGPFIVGSSDEQLQRTVGECNTVQGNCEIGWFDQESPQRTIELGSFAISKYETANQQYNLCVRAGVCERPKQEINEGIPYSSLFFEDNYPVVGINFYDASTFCNWIGGRLPTEEEWEKAARGTDGRRYSWGDEFGAGRSNLSASGPTPVGSYPDGNSPYGVADVAGNAFEWTNTAITGKYMLRGGSWHTPSFRGRTTDRGTKLPPDFANYDIGFRCVK